eukprot:5147456-Prymnesium_polylepis.1
MAQTMRLMGTIMGELKAMILQQGRELNMLRTQLALITSGVSSGVKPATAAAAEQHPEVVLTATVMDGDGDGDNRKSIPLEGFGSLLPMTATTETVQRLSASTAPELFLEWFEKGCPVSGWPGLEKQEVPKLNDIVE